MEMNRCPIRYVRRKTLLNRSLVEWTDYNCNHYIGCFHGCRYPCYAQKISRQKYAQWRSVAVVENALELAVKEIENIPLTARIMVSSFTDPYQPIEEHEKLTRSLLPILAGYRQRACSVLPNVIIITKSDLVRRDFELIKQFSNIALCMTITSCNNLGQFEPYAPGNRARIACLQEAKALGIHTIASVEPWIPGLTRIMELVRLIYPYVDEFFIGSWNHRFRKDSENYKKMLKVYRRWLPDVYNFLQERMKKVLIKRELVKMLGIKKGRDPQFEQCIDKAKNEPRNLSTHKYCREDTGQKKQV